jgi:prepilin-type N-terminal cleavage/methylation domain-containing protein
MNGKQKGFTLIEILVVVTIIGVLAGLVVVLIPKSQEKAQITECTNNQRNIVGMLITADDKAWGYSGPNMLLYLAKHEDIKGTNLRLFFCPGDPDPQQKFDKVGGEDAFKNLDLKVQDLGHLTSYAGRDQSTMKCVVKKGNTSPEVIICDDKEDNHGKKGFVCGYNDGRVAFLDKVNDWDKDISESVAIGEASTVPALQCLRAE